MKSIVVILFITLLVACGPRPHKVVAVKAGDDYYKPDRAAAMALDTGTDEKIVCERRIKTGSHRKQRVCTTVSQKERDRKAAKETIDSGNLFNSRQIVDQKGGGG